MFSAVEFERRNGKPVFIQPRHVAALVPVEGPQVTDTNAVMANGDVYELTGTPTDVARRLNGGR